MSKGSAFIVRPIRRTLMQLPSKIESCVLPSKLIGCGIFLQEHAKHVRICRIHPWPQTAPCKEGHPINPQAS